jgi:predicted component of type VI protein secretion system
MSFEEMQSILQGILLSQQQLQLSQQQFQSELVETKAAADRAIQIAESNGRAIQSMLDQAAADRLDEQERIRRHEEEMRELKATNRGLVNLAVSIDEDRPTILRLLNSNNNKLDLLLDRLPPQQQ